MKKSPLDFLSALLGKHDREHPHFSENSVLADAAHTHAFAASRFATDEIESSLDDGHHDDHVCGPDCDCGHAGHDHGNLWYELEGDNVFEDDWSAVKPAHAGGGSGGGKGGGKGKTKDEPVVEEPTDGGGTGTDTGGTTGDTGGTTGDTGGTTGETGGSGDFGWLSDTEYLSGGDTPNGFNVALSFEGTGWTDAYKAKVTEIAELISDMISLDVPDYGGVDDVHFRVLLGSVDGSGGVLGTGGIYSLRPDTGIPYKSGIRIDEADIASRFDTNLSDIIFHEMMHGLGFDRNTWTKMGLVEEIGGSLRFTGENAINAYNALYPEAAGNDPYSDQGVKLDSYGSHFTGVPGSEIMTPTLYKSGNEITDLTLAALEDMGYETAYPDEPEEIDALVV